MAALAPGLFLAGRYLWWRLVWQPLGNFPAPSASTPSTATPPTSTLRHPKQDQDQQQQEEQGEWQGDVYTDAMSMMYSMSCLIGTRQVCCPERCDYRGVCCPQGEPRGSRVGYLVATVVYWGVWVCVCVVMGLQGVAHSSVDPPLFFVVGYNMGGAVVVLVVSVWVVDTAALLLTGVLAVWRLYVSEDVSSGEHQTQDGARFTRVSTAVVVDKEREQVHRSGSKEDEDVDGDGDGDGVSMSVHVRSQDMVLRDGNDMDVMQGDEEEGVVLGSDVVQGRGKCVIPTVGDHEMLSALSETTPTLTHVRHRRDSLQLRTYSRIKAVLIWIVFMIMIVFSSVDSYGDPRLIEVSIPLRHLPECADGFKLALLTDVHAGALVGSEDMARIVKLVQQWSPHAVALSGDLGDQPVNSALKDKLAPLASLETIPAGVFWTPGNHENLAGIQGYRDLFSPDSIQNNKTSPLNFIKTLENSFETININVSVTGASVDDCSFDIAGLADASGEDSTGSGQIAPDIRQTLQGHNLSQALVLLNHQPLHFKRYAEAGAGLTLAGHTHGGQIWPNHAILWFVYGTHIAGLFSDNNGYGSSASDDPSYLYVSEGTVGWGPRVRLLSYPEITLITLRNPVLFAADGGSTAADESWRVAVIGLVCGMVALPLAMIVCTMRSFGCWGRVKSESEIQ